MRSRQLFSAFLFLIAAQLFFACGTAKFYDFGASSTAYRETKKASDKQKAANAENAAATAEFAAAKNTTAAETEIPALLASAAEATPALPVNKMYEADRNQAQGITTVATTTEMKAPVLTDLKTKVEKKQKKGLFGGIKAIKATVLEIIFAILIPPVGVAIHEGITARFWISLVLTLLFWLPGAIYALLVVTESI